MKNKLLKKLRRQFASQYTVKNDRESITKYSIYHNGIYDASCRDYEDLHLAIRARYFRFLQDYLDKHGRVVNHRLVYLW